MITNPNLHQVAENVYICDHTYCSSRHVLHECSNEETMHNMILRDNEDGPMYWCEGCGYTLIEGEAMAVRLHEVDI